MSFAVESFILSCLVVCPLTKKKKSSKIRAREVSEKSVDNFIIISMKNEG